MKFKQIMLFGFCPIFITLLPISSVYSQNLLSPQIAIQDVSDKLHQRLQDQLLKKDFAKTNQLVNEVIYPHTDFDMVSALVLGKISKTATHDERKRFKHEFQTLFIRIYSRAFTEFKDWSVHLLPIDMEPGAKKVLVETEVLQPGFQPVSINYRMFLSKSGQWKIYDLIIEDASLVENYRKTFSNEVQQKGSLATVIDELAKRNTEALSSSSLVVSSNSTVSGNSTDASDSRTAANQVTTSNCPTTLALNYDGRNEQLEVRALKEKLFTQAELDEYYERLLSDLEEAKAWVAQYDSLFTSIYYTNEEYEPKHALYGCPAGFVNTGYGSTTNCYRLDYNPSELVDSITPRIELYRCHKEAGWPSATDIGHKKPKKQCDVSSLNSVINNAQSVNGFNFKIVEERNGTKFIEGYGGPCRNVGVEKLTIQLEAVKNFKKGFGKKTSFSVMGNSPSSGLEFSNTISHNDDFARSTNYHRDRWQHDASVGSPSAVSEKESYMISECIEMNHQKYEVALEDWVGANLKALKNCTSSD